MRLHFTLTPNTQPVPFSYQHFLTGAFHKWLGNNQLHDDISLYSLSWLYQGKMEGGALEFPRGARWFLSFHDESLTQTLIDNILKQPEVCCGMRIIRIDPQQTPYFGSRYTFKVRSPVLAKSKQIEGQVKHYIYTDSEADTMLTATLRHKLDHAGLGAPHNEVVVGFDRTYSKPKTKLVQIKEIANRASMCPVIVEGTPEATRFAWNVGIGHGTGSGFGALWE